MPTREELLHVYLRDHLAGATGGLALARRLAGKHRGGWAGNDLADFAVDVAQDRASLVATMDALGVRHNVAKRLLASVGERLGRLKLNGELWRRSPLSTVVELEIMRMGVEGKASAWRTLIQLASANDRLDDEELTTLLGRAEQQATLLERLCAQAAAEALATPTK